MSNNEDLHGSAPDKSKVALLIIDMICDFEFEDGEKLYAQTEPMIENLVEFKRRARAAGVPAIYVNDNFGRWQSDFKKLLAHSQDESRRGSKIANLLAPDEDDYFVLKPKHSGFYSTTVSDSRFQIPDCKSAVCN